MRLLKAIGAVLIARWFWTLVGALLLAVLIWLFGDLLVLGSVRPFANEVRKLLAILVIAVIWGVSNLWSQVRARRKNDAMVAELAAPAQVATPGDAEVAELARRFGGALDVLRKRRVRSKHDRRWLYQLPWYVIIGPPGSGKTTALVQSGLRFPLGSLTELRGVGGTRYCDWFFTDSAVLIDTAGRYVSQDTDQPSDAAAWLGFLKLLKKHRPRQPLNGVIVALSVRDLIQRRSAGEIDHAATIRARLDELAQQLGVKLPVYLVLTKADLIAGFGEFFADLDEAGRRQVWGVTAEHRVGAEPVLDVSTLRSAFETLVSRLDARQLDRLSSERDLNRRALIFGFPANVAGLREELLQFIQAVFGNTGYGETHWLRGVYLTSGVQTGTSVDRLFGAVARNFGLAVEPPPVAAGDRSFFLTRLLQELIFGEASLVGRDARRERREGWLRGAAYAALAGLAVLAIGGWSWSYVENRDRQLAVENELVRWARDAGPVAKDRLLRQDASLGPVMELLDRLAAIRSPLEATDSTHMRLGLSQRRRTADQLDMAYVDALTDLLLPRLVLRLEEQMRARMDDPEFLLDALKIYLMLGGRAPVDAELVEAWAFADLNAESPHVSHLVQELPEIERRPAVDGQLIARAKSALTQIPLAKRAYSALVESADVRSLPGWSVTDHAGPQASATLVRRSGKPLDAPIPGLFTYDGFHFTLLEVLDGAARAAFAENWVLGSGQAPEPTQAEVEQLKADMLRLYYDDFIAAWDGLLRDITLAPLGTLDQAVEATKALSGPSSPLKLLVDAIVTETSLTVPPPVEEEEGTDPAAAAKTAAKVAGKLNSKLGKLSKLAKFAGKLGGGEAQAMPQEIPGEPVERHFVYLKQMVEGAGGAPPVLDEALQALGALNAKLTEVALSPNPKQAFAAVGPTGAKQLAQAAARLPAPLNQMLGGVAAKAGAMTAGGIREQLNAVWRADVLDRCRAALSRRFPFAPNSSVDANIEDVVTVLGPGGLIDGFIRDQLAPFVDTTRRPWADLQGVGLSRNALSQLERANRITKSLFAGGSGPKASFSLTPIELDAGSRSLTLDIDGQVLRYAHGPSRPQAFVWPGPNGTNIIRLDFVPVDGSTPVAVNKEGAWSLFRLLQEAQFERTDQPDKFFVTIAHAGHLVRFQLKAGSVENPFNLTVLSGFECPGGL